MLDLKGVSHRTGREFVLDQGSLQVEPGRTCVILAPPGSGRSALLRLMAGLERPEKGTVRFGSENAWESKTLKTGVMFVRKFGADMTARKARAVIHQAARKGGMSSRAADAEVGRAAAATGLGGRLEQKVKDLDLEARIRLQLAMAAAQRPKLLLLDEPLAGLEGEARARLLVDLAAMLSIGERVVIVYATSSPEEARVIGGDLAVVDAGRIAQAGPAADVLDHPRDLATARATTFPALNVVEIVWQDGARRLADGSTFAPPPGLELPAEGGFSMAFRPADARTSRSDASAVRFLVRGAGAATIGGVMYARASFAGQDWLMALPPAGEPAPGVMLNVFVDRDHVMIFDAAGLALPPPLPKRAAG